MTAVTETRWAAAQEAELRYWREMSVAELFRICAEKPAFLELLGREIRADLFAGKEVLEIGTGPLGISVVSFCAEKAELRRLVKVDPLPRLDFAALSVSKADWAAGFVGFAREIAAEGEYRTCPGEDFDEEAAYDTVVTYNVLDHVRDPGAILDRAFAALRPGGRLLVGVDCLSYFGRMKFEAYIRRRHRGSILVEAHPHTFLPWHVRRMMAHAGFGEVSCFGLPGPVRSVLGSHTRPAFLGVKPGRAG